STLSLHDALPILIRKANLGSGQTGGSLFGARSSMKRLAAAASLLCVVGPVLAGCGALEIPEWILSPFPDSRSGGAPPDYAVAMRVGAAAHAAGDLATAVGSYRRASLLEPLISAAFVAEGNTLVEMGVIDEAIVAYLAAEIRNPRDQEALRGLARAYLLT